MNSYNLINYTIIDVYENINDEHDYIFTLRDNSSNDIGYFAYYPISFCLLNPATGEIADADTVTNWFSYLELFNGLEDHFYREFGFGIDLDDDDEILDGSLEDIFEALLNEES